MRYQKLTQTIGQMANSPLRNYIVPGLTSHLIGGNQFGKVRMFTSDRNQRDFIAPHSHRFDFTCLVLAGRVTNVIYLGGYAAQDPATNLYVRTKMTLVPMGKQGQYVTEPGDKPEWFIERRADYEEGDTYSMGYRDIHSICFHKGAKVLFFEGPEIVDHSFVLEPWSNDKRVPTFTTQKWMFEHD